MKVHENRLISNRAEKWSLNWRETEQEQGINAGKLTKERQWKEEWKSERKDTKR